jgi:hypothetical protein
MSVCPYCQRAFRNERGLKVHLSYCSEKLRVEEEERRKRQELLMKISGGYLLWGEHLLPPKERAQLVAERCLKHHECWDVCDVHLIAELVSCVEVALGLVEGPPFRCHACRGEHLYPCDDAEDVERLEEELEKKCKWGLEGDFLAVKWEGLSHATKAILTIRHPKYAVTAELSHVIHFSEDDNSGHAIEYIWIREVGKVVVELLYPGVG